MTTDAHLIDPPLFSSATAGSHGQSASAVDANLRESMQAGARFAERNEVHELRDDLREKKLWLHIDSPERIAQHAARREAETRAPEPTAQLKARVEAHSNEPAPSLRIALERIIGPTSDLQPFTSYLDRALIAGRAVGRIQMRTDQGLSYGTGFLVSPSLLLTNHHVLPDIAAAGRSLVQFGFERGLDDALRLGAGYPLDPPRFFLTDETLDFTLVAVGGDAAIRAALGFLRLDGLTGKVLIDQCVNIIQHPGAGEKQIALRQNKLIDVLDDFLHYETDTMPGASGSPVFNDQWQVVALHHAGVPKMDADGHPLAIDDTPWTEARGEDAVQWIANEGIRVSRIVSRLTELGKTLPAAAQRMLDEAIATFPAAAIPQPVAAALNADPVGTNPGNKERVMPGNGNGNAAPGASVATLDAASTAGGSTKPMTSRFASAAGEAGADAAMVTLSVPTNRPIEVFVRINPLESPTAAATGMRPEVVAALRPALGREVAGGKVPRSALAMGDVLLYQGTGIVSKGIMLLTDSKVSHAALYLGGDTVGEAVGEGVVRHTLDQSFPDHNFVLVRRLPQQLDMQPVVARGQFYLGQGLKYSYQQIVFLAILLIVKKVKPSGVVGKLIMVAAQAAAAALNELLHGGKELMICSEFVYRSYDEASQAKPNPYRLNVPGLGGLGFESTLRAKSVIDPESVLAQLVTRGAFANVRVQESMLAPAALDREALERETKALLAEHIRQVETGVPAVRLEEAFVPPPTPAELTSAVTQLATALQATRLSSEFGKEGAIAALQQESVIPALVPAAVALLFKTPADFVTPADLMNTSSLETLGNVYP
jgi:hypothetical protein